MTKDKSGQTGSCEKIIPLKQVLEIARIWAKRKEIDLDDLQKLNEVTK